MHKRLHSNVQDFGNVIFSWSTIFQRDSFRSAFACHTRKQSLRPQVLTWAPRGRELAASGRIPRPQLLIDRPTSSSRWFAREHRNSSILKPSEVGWSARHTEKSFRAQYSTLAAAQEVVKALRIERTRETKLEMSNSNVSGTWCLNPSTTRATVEADLLPQNAGRVTDSSAGEAKAAKQSLGDPCRLSEPVTPPAVCHARIKGHRLRAEAGCALRRHLRAGGRLFSFPARCSRLAKPSPILPASIYGGHSAPKPGVMSGWPDCGTTSAGLVAT